MFASIVSTGKKTNLRDFVSLAQNYAAYLRQKMRYRWIPILNSHVFIKPTCLHTIFSEYFAPRIVLVEVTQYACCEALTTIAVASTKKIQNN